MVYCIILYRLFTYVNEEALDNKPTFVAFRNLLDNYNPNYGDDEVVTPNDEAEEKAFLDLIMATKVMTKTTNFLISKGKACRSFKSQFFFLKSPTKSPIFNH